MENRVKGFDYKWVIVLISGLMVFTALGFCSSANGIYIKPITETLGIARTSYSVTTSVRYVTTAVVNLFFGALIYRFGAKNLILTGFVSLIASTLIYSVATTVPVFCIGSMFLGIGLSFTTTTMVGSVINRWCAKNKGTIMGFVLASNGIGAALARAILTPIINGDTYGFRTSYRVVAIILAAVGAVMLIFFRNDPKGSEKVRIVKAKKEITDKDRRVFKMPYFYVSLVCIFLTGLVLQSVHNIADPHLSDAGLESTFITTVLSLNSIVLSGSKFGVGFIYDNVGIRVSSLICYVSAIVAFIALFSVSSSSFGHAISFVYSVFSSIALPLETIMLPIFARELFGDNGFNKALGIFVSVNTAGYAIGGPIANAVYDLSGSYKLWLIITTLIIAAIIVVMNVVLTVAKRRLNEETKQELLTA